MPILDVQIIGDLEPEVSLGLAQRLAEAVAGALQSRPGGTWVKVTSLPREQYAENAAGPGEGVRPVFVRVLKREVPRGEELKQEVSELTRAIASLCGRAAENIHILYLPPAKGRVAFGGVLVE